MPKLKGTLKTCSRGHRFYKSSDCPVCPKCWKGDALKRGQSDFPEKIGAPAVRALLSIKVTKLVHLAKHREADIEDLHGMGPKALGLLKSAMRRQGVSFKK